MNRWEILVTCGVIATSFMATADARPRLLEQLREARAERSQDAGGASSQTVRVDGLDRSYLLLDAHRGNGPAPLVIVLHGGGGNPETMLPRWVDKARTAGLLVAAPKGIGRNERMGTWNAGGCCGEALSRGVDDVGFVAAVIEDVARKASVDRRRIYVTGFSNGGMLTHRIAIALGDRIAAAAVVSGALFGNEPAARAPVPMLIMHGEQDANVGFNGGMSQTGFIAKGQTFPFKPVRYAVDYWRAANGCADAPAVTHRPGVVTEQSTGCHGHADVVLYDLPQGGHRWPGTGGSRHPGEDDAGAVPLDATDTIWDFFRMHTK